MPVPIAPSASSDSHTRGGRSTCPVATNGAIRPNSTVAQNSCAAASPSGAATPRQPLAAYGAVSQQGERAEHDPGKHDLGRGHAVECDLDEQEAAAPDPCKHSDSGERAATHRRSPVTSTAATTAGQPAACL